MLSDAHFTDLGWHVKYILYFLLALPTLSAQRRPRLTLLRYLCSTQRTLIQNLLPYKSTLYNARPREYYGEPGQTGLSKFVFDI